MTTKPNEKYMREAVKEGNFLQWFKMRIWEAKKGNFVPEAELDKIGAEAYEKIKSQTIDDVVERVNEISFYHETKIKNDARDDIVDVIKSLQSPKNPKTDL